MRTKCRSRTRLDHMASDLNIDNVLPAQQLNHDYLAFKGLRSRCIQHMDNRRANTKDHIRRISRSGKAVCLGDSKNRWCCTILAMDIDVPIGFGTRQEVHAW